VLTSNRLAEYCNGINEATLPQTVKDTIEVTRDLGLRYLWIDAYCIIQDCERDKTREIRRMGEVYKNSYITIVAAGAASVKSGFLAFQDSPPIWCLPICFRDGCIGNIILQHWSFNVEDLFEPIASRAWTLQERLLSSRLLLFPSRVYKLRWKCHTIQQSDCGIGEFSFPTDSRLLPRSLFPLHIQSAFTVPVHRLCYKWAEIIEEYSCRILSKPEDKLPAIAGIAAEFHNVWGGEYCAGLWKRFMPQQLMWNTNPSYGDPSTFPVISNHYRAPSWSWASLDGKLDVPRGPYLPSSQFDIIRCEISLADESAPFASVLAGSLVVKGLLKEGLVRGLYLYSEKNEEGAIANARMDMWVRAVGEATVTCLALGMKNEDLDSTFDCESITSETSSDTLDTVGVTEGLLLRPVENRSSQRAFRRIGTFRPRGNSALDTWFNDCIPQEIIIL
jgi:hypothetical protein